MRALLTYTSATMESDANCARSAAAAASVLVTTPQRSGSHFMSDLLRSGGLAQNDEFTGCTGALKNDPEGWRTALASLLPATRSNSVIVHPNCLYNVSDAGKCRRADSRCCTDDVHRSSS